MSAIRCRTIGSLLMLLPISACCTTTRIVPDPKEISLEAAMASVGNGLNEMRTAQGDLTTGLVPSEVTIVFNVKASATDSSKLAIDVSPAASAGLPVTGKVGAEATSMASAERGNQVTVKFSNVLYAPKDLLITGKSAKELDEILATLKKRGIHLYVK